MNSLISLSNQISKDKIDFPEAPLKESILGEHAALTKWVHVCRAGATRDGRKIPLESLELLVENFYQQADQKPVYIGHIDQEPPKGQKPLPADGWVLGLVLEGKDLFAFMEFRENLAKEIAEGGYRSTSIFAAVVSDDEGKPTKAELMSIAVLNNPAVTNLRSIAASTFFGKSETSEISKDDGTPSTLDILEFEETNPMTDKAKDETKTEETGEPKLSLEDALAKIEALSTSIEVLKSENADLKASLDKYEKEASDRKKAETEAQVDKAIAAHVQLKAKREELLTLATNHPTAFELMLSTLESTAPEAPKGRFHSVDKSEEQPTNRKGFLLADVKGN